MKHAALFLIALTLGGCSQSAESKAFFQKLEAIFNSGAKSITLSEVTSFPWDELCIFKIAGSYNSIAYATYQDHLLKKELEGKVPADDFGLIFVFSNNGKITNEYYQRDPNLTVNTIPTEISLASKKSFVKFCSEPQGLKLTYVDAEEERPTIYISREQ